MSRDLEKIIAGCKKGQNSAYSELVDCYSQKIYAYFYRLTGNRDISNDLLSELFLKVIKNIKKFKDGSFDSWIYKIASNVFHDFLREKQKQRKINSEYAENAESFYLDSQHEKADMGQHLQNQLNKIDAEEREIVLLRFYSDLSFKEIAEIRNEPIGTTLSKLHRSLKKLRSLIGQSK